jgi:transcriptional regulator with XRE-family HTH domain
MTTDSLSPIAELLNQPGGIAVRLRSMLDEAGMTGKDFASATGLSPSKVSKLRLGQQVPSSDDIERWTRACGREGEANELIGLADQVASEHRAWKQQLRGGHAKLQDSLVPLDEVSTRIRTYQTSTVPGPLQTADYARAVFSEQTELRCLVDNDIDSAVAKRLERQRLLYDPAKSWEILLDEAILLRPVFGVQVTLAQVDRLQSVIGLPNVRFGVLPLDQPTGVSPLHAFTLFDDVGLVEGFVDGSRHEGDGAAFLHRVLDKLWEQAVEGEDVRAVLARAVERLYGLSPRKTGTRPEDPDR